MAVCTRMLRFGRLRAGIPGVLGARAVLFRDWREARWQGVRPFRYRSRGRERAGQSNGGVGVGSCRASLGADPTGAGRPAAAACLDGARVSRYPTPPTLATGNTGLAAQVEARLVAGSGPVLTLASGTGL